MKRVALLLACAVLAFVGPANAVTADCSQFYRPIAPWTGQMILPDLGKRAPDGSVPFLVFTSPQQNLVGRILRLAWDDSQPEDGWFQKSRPKVVFDPKTRATGEKAGCRFPTILDGWDAVSPLESLPANRHEGTIEVVLKNPILRGETLLVRDEPVQVNGSHVCLAKFVGPADGNQRRIKHFNPRTGFFTGPEEIVTIMPAKARPDDSAPNTSTEKIEESPLNDQGWYMYGKKIRGSFLVKSLEPRVVTRAFPPCLVGGKDRVKDYVARNHFDNLKPQLARVSIFEPRQDMIPDQTGTGMTGYTERVWPVGTRALLIHLFGWRKLEGAPPSKGDQVSAMLDLVTGHFSFGIAEVIKDPFTGEPRWDIEYKQVYGHNREEVVSGSMKWHAYMGNLRRGWMYCLPVSDTIIGIPELQPFTIGNETIDPLRGLSRELERMMALYRVGGGTGCATIRPDVSCVQDSHAALYSGIHILLEKLGEQPAVKQWLQSKGASDPEVQRFNSLKRLGADIEHAITSFSTAQGSWKDFYANPLGTRPPGSANPILNTLLSLNTLFPRGAHDQFLQMAADRGYPMWSILTVQIGGLMPGVIPLKPNTPRNH